MTGTQYEDTPSWDDLRKKLEEAVAADGDALKCSILLGKLAADLKRLSLFYLAILPRHERKARGVL